MAKKEIVFSIELDDNKMPKSIEWEATDAPFKGKKACSAMMIYLWDRDSDAPMSMDLWTNDMMIHHMNGMVFNNMMSMADTYQRATRNDEAANAMREFAKQFAEKMKNK